MLQNKSGDMTPFAMSERPSRPSALLLPVIWAASWAATRGGRLKIHREGMQGLRPPYLVLAEHQGFTDYYIAPLALFPHRASYVSDVEGFAAFGKCLYAMTGCIATRRFAGDSALIRNIRHVVEHNGDSIVVFPEARHSNVGTNSPLPASVGKLVKLLGIPVVTLKTHGSYLTSPIWDESHRRRAPLSARLELALTPAQIGFFAPREITALLNRRFAYDEYRWQWENRISIPYPERARGLHKVLYQCPCCLVEHAMSSGGDALWCTACAKRWRMDEYGRLSCPEQSAPYSHIPDWYEFQRREVEREIDEGRYRLDTPVQVEALPNEKGFVSMGGGRLEHGPRGFRLSLSSGETLCFSSRSMPSVHTEYDYRSRGDCIVLSTRGCCYYLYFDCPGPGNTGPVGVTKLQFAAEYFHRLSRSPATGIPSLQQPAGPEESRV